MWPTLETRLAHILFQNSQKHVGIWKVGTALDADFVQTVAMDQNFILTGQLEKHCGVRRCA